MGATAKYDYVNGRVINEWVYSGSKKDALWPVSTRAYTIDLKDKERTVKMFYSMPLSTTVVNGYNTLKSQRGRVTAVMTLIGSLGAGVGSSREDQWFSYPTERSNDYRDFLPVSKKILLGNVLQKTVFYKYPHSLLAAGSTHTIAKLAASANGDRTTVIEELLCNRDGRIVSGTLNDFSQDATSGVFVPLATYQLDLDNPLPGNTVTVSLTPNSAAWQINSAYMKYVDYIHNSDGRLLQLSDRSKTMLTYIWGYNNLYPIAEVQNASYAEVQAVLGGATLTSLNSATVDEATIRTAMVKLRSDNRMKKTLIASYIHSPLGGMRSKFDFRNISESYELDGFQRLIGVKDDDGNLLRNYAYNRTSIQVVPTKFYNTVQSKTFTKNDCPPQTYPNYAEGTAVTYTVPAGKYTSSISQADADLRAIDEINSLGQAYANKNGTCTYGVIIEW